MNVDVWIHGGTVIDGTGKPGRPLDVLVSGGEILDVGRFEEVEAKTIIHADGYVVAPGFIDVHNHAHAEMDGGILNIPDADNMVRQGVTTLVAGNCGGSAFPVGQHLDAVAMKEIHQNYTTLVGYNTIRRQALRESGHRIPDTDDLKKMQQLLGQALEEGAVGMSTGMPGASFTDDEIAQVVQPLVSHRRTYASHIRDEGGNCLEAIAELIAVGEKAGASVQISHLKTFGPHGWDKLERILEMIEAAQQHGVDVLCDRYPYVGAFSGLQRLIPSWAWSWASERGGLAAWKSEEAPEKLHGDIEAEIDAVGGAERIVFAPLEPVPEIDGRTLAEVAEEQNQSVTATVIEWVVHGGISVIWLAMREDNLQVILKHPSVMVASDGHLRVHGKGISHPRNFGTFPRVLGRYVRTEGILTLEEAIHKMTGMPASKFGFQNRGTMAKGKAADIVVFDADTVLDKATFEDGNQYPVGIEYVLVNGRIAIAESKTTDVKAGKVLR